jgi:hypothetical protein
MRAVSRLWNPELAFRAALAVDDRVGWLVLIDGQIRAPATLVCSLMAAALNASQTFRLITRHHAS